MSLIRELNLIEAATKSNAFLKLTEQIRTGAKGPFNVFGLNDLGKPLLATLIQDANLRQQNKSSPILYIVPDVLRARSLAREVEALTGKPVPVLHAEVSDFLGRGVKDRSEEIKRLQVLNAFYNGEEPVLIISASLLLEKLPSPQFLEENKLKLEVGKTYQYEDLAQALEALGYLRVREVDTYGQFSVRGEIIDVGVFSSEGEGDSAISGVRLSFFDVELEELKLFDLVNQRSTNQLRSIEIPPIKESLYSEEVREKLATLMGERAEQGIQDAIRSGANKEQSDYLSQWTKADIESFRNGLSFAGKSRWNFMIRDEVASILDYAKGISAVVMMEEPKLSRSRVDAANAEFHQEVQTLLEKYSVFPEVIENQFNPADAFVKLHEYPEMVFTLSNLQSSGNGLPGGTNHTFHFVDAPNYRAREEELFRSVREWQEDDWTIVLAVPQERPRKRLREIFLQESITLPIFENGINDGLIWSEARLVILGSQNLLGRIRTTRQKRKKKEGSEIHFFGELKIGEYVVHDVHGIGQYLGLKTLQSGKSSRDYLHIAYKGDDSLYIPVDQLDEIQRYIATDGQKARLSKLGSKEWERKKERVRESVKKLAIDLLAVYSQREKRQGYAFSEDTVWQSEFEDNFPYVETEDQMTSIQEIKRDMESAKIMDRLLCGDVGFGKTEIAFRAIFKAVMSGKQAAMIVPTTVLCQQHYQSFLERIKGFPMEVRQLSRFVTDKKRKDYFKDLATGTCDVVIGTHSVLNKNLEFKNLGLLVIDEEQRFGVEHKELLKDRYPTVDVLTLSATPIPRTLHMAVSGVRDISLLSEGPADRRPIQTYVMEYEEEIINEAILREISRGGQVFYILNDIRKLPAKQAEIEERLPGVEVRRAHGRMAERQIEDTIGDFISGKFDVLLSTTIIESGIDMPNVNTLVVERAERMGLAQLYQLRGRVGRSEVQAFAYVTYPKDTILKEDAQKRLAAIRDFTELGSGLNIAMRDLEVRGAGNFLGGEQSGHMGAVGYDLYTRMLEESINELRGIEPIVKAEPTVIDLEIDALIPASYIEDEGQRMEVYKRILYLENSDDWHDILDELLDRFGDPPRSVMNLLDISLVRAEAGRAGVARIEQRRNHLVLNLDSARVDNERIFSLFQIEHFSGKLYYDASNKPSITLLGGAEREDNIAETLRKLWIL